MVLKPIHIAGVVGILTLAVSSCEEADYSGEDGKPDGEKIYAANCSSCHGETGDAGVSGAKDLSASILDQNEMISIITNGSGAMMPFNAMLKPAEIEAVADYAMTLRK